MDFKQALVYPFTEDRWLHCALIPGIFVFVCATISQVLSLFSEIGTLMGSASASGGADMAAVGVMGLLIMFGAGLLSMLPSLVQSIILSGFYWNMMNNLIAEGPDAPSPNWVDDFKDLLIDGLKYFLFSIVLSLGLGLAFGLPIVVLLFALGVANGGGDFALPGMLIFGMSGLFVLTMLAISPFLMAPMIHTARTRSFVDLFNVNRAIAITLPRYGRIWMSFIMCLGVFLCYCVLSVGLILTCVGVMLLPLVWGGPYTASVMHLLYQGFDVTDEDLKAIGAPVPVTTSGDHYQQS